ncbi:hypothetical protein HK405_004296 [Cladochytrium tenue]|nr:hypothetical protein HK405_004296 [Cladochytrium tenue]
MLVEVDQSHAAGVAPLPAVVVPATFPQPAGEAGGKIIPTPPASVTKTASNPIRPSLAASSSKTPVRTLPIRTDPRKTSFSVSTSASATPTKKLSKPSTQHTPTTTAAQLTSSRPAVPVGADSSDQDKRLQDAESEIPVMPSLDMDSILLTDQQLGGRRYFLSDVVKVKGPEPAATPVVDLLMPDGSVREPAARSVPLSQARYCGLGGRWSQLGKRTVWTRLPTVVLEGTLGRSSEPPELSDALRVVANDLDSFGRFMKKPAPYKAVISSGIWDDVDRAVREVQSKSMDSIRNGTFESKSTTLMGQINDVIKGLENIISSATHLDVNQWIIWREAEARVVIVSEELEDVVLMWASWRSSLKLLHLVYDEKRNWPLRGHCSFCLQLLDVVELLYTGLGIFKDAAELWLHRKELICFVPFSTEELLWKQVLESKKLLLDAVLPPHRPTVLSPHRPKWGPKLVPFKLNPDSDSEFARKLRFVSSASVTYRSFDEHSSTLTLGCRRPSGSVALPIANWLEFSLGSGRRLRAAGTLKDESRRRLLSRYIPQGRLLLNPQLLTGSGTSGGGAAATTGDGLSSPLPPIETVEAVMQTITFAFETAPDFRLLWAATVATLALEEDKAAAQLSQSVWLGTTKEGHEVLQVGLVKTKRNEECPEVVLDAKELVWVGSMCPATCESCYGLAGGACDAGRENLNGHSYQVYFVGSVSATGSFSRESTLVTTHPVPLEKWEDVSFL